MNDKTIKNSSSARGNGKKNTREGVKNFKRLAWYFKGYRLSLAVSAVCSAVTALLTLAVPVLVGRAINLAVGPGEVDFARIGRTALFIALCAGGYALFGWLGNAANNRASFGIVRDIRSDAAHKLTHLPLAYLDSHQQGELLSRITTDADIVGDGLLLAFTNFTSALVTMIGALTVMFIFSPVVAAIVVLLTPVSVLVAARVASSISSSYKKASEERGRLTKIIDQYVSGRKTVAAFSREEEKKNLLQQALDLSIN